MYTDFSGLSEREAEASRQKYGLNEQLYKPTFKRNLLCGITGFSCKLFVIAALIGIISVLLGLLEVTEAAEDFTDIFILFGLAVLCALFEAVLRYRSEAILNKVCGTSLCTYRVLRSSGKIEEIAENMLAVGDIVFVSRGDFIPADGIVADGQIVVDQSEFGILEKTEKTTPPSSFRSSRVLGVKNPYCVYSGSVVCSGSCAFRITAVGKNTHLAQKNKNCGAEIYSGNFRRLINSGMLIGGAAALTVLIFHMINGALSGSLAEGLLSGISAAAVVLAVSSFCGKSLICTASAAGAVGRLRKKNVYAANPDVLNKVPEAAVVFTDKSGVITEGCYTASGFIDGSGKEFSNIDSVCEKNSSLLKAAVISTSSAQYGADGIARGGNSAERAALEFVGYNEKLKIKKQSEVCADGSFGLSGASVNSDGKTVTYICGGVETVMERCTDSCGTDGKRRKITNKDALIKLAAAISLTGSDVVAYAVSDKPIKGSKLPDGSFSLIGFMVMRDSVCDNAEASVMTLEKLGVRTVLITGAGRENTIFTLKASGLKKSNGVILSSEQFAKMSDKEAVKRFSEIKAVVRANAEDKKRMIRIAHENGLQVCVIGSEMNDIQAFGEADAAIASATAVSAVKKASDASADGCGIQAAADLFSHSAKFMGRCRAFISARIVCSVIIAIIAIFSVIGW